MEAAGPFEDGTVLAVAVSGGADSLSLVLAASDWANGCGGRVVALTVDHGLRPESADEAARVRKWMADLGIEHHILHWHRDQPPGGSLQAEARTARYRLLRAWCRAHGVLHLLVAHHLRDQVETVEMRRKRNPGGDGMSGMALVSENPDIRIIRPFLGVLSEEIRAQLTALGLPWIEDPSNRDERYERIRIRHALPGDITQAGEEAAERGRNRALSDGAVARALAEVVTTSPQGFLMLDRAGFNEQPSEVRIRLLGRVIRTVRGASYLERFASLDRLMTDVSGDRARDRTLGGCRFLVCRSVIYVCRESAGTDGPSALVPGETTVWDARFRVRLIKAEGAGDYEFGMLGAEGWRACKDWPELAYMASLPAPVRHAVPCIRQNGEVSWVLRLTGRSFGGHPERLIEAEIRSAVAEPLGKSRFFVASGAE